MTGTTFGIGSPATQLGSTMPWMQSPFSGALQSFQGVPQQLYQLHQLEHAQLQQIQHVQQVVQIIAQQVQQLQQIVQFVPYVIQQLQQQAQAQQAPFGAGMPGLSAFSVPQAVGGAAGWSGAFYPPQGQVM